MITSACWRVNWTDWILAVEHRIDLTGITVHQSCPLSYTHFGECTPENHILLSEAQASLYMTFLDVFWFLLLAGGAEIGRLSLCLSKQREVFHQFWKPALNKWLSIAWGLIETKCTQPDNPTQTLVLLHWWWYSPISSFVCQKCYLYHNKILTVNSGVWWFGMVLVVQSWLVWFLFLQPCFPLQPSHLGALCYWCCLWWLSRKHSHCHSFVCESMWEEEWTFCMGNVNICN